jgi:hypothetical protein
LLFSPRKKKKKLLQMNIIYLQGIYERLFIQSQPLAINKWFDNNSSRAVDPVLCLSEGVLSYYSRGSESGAIKRLSPFQSAEPALAPARSQHHTRD